MSREKAGQPTKYTEDHIKRAIEYIESTDIPFIEELAGIFEVDEDTIGNWAKTHKKFFGAIKRLKTKQKFRLMKMGLTDRKVNTVMAIFQLKANHGLKETQVVENQYSVIELDIDGDEDQTEDQKLEESI